MRRIEIFTFTFDAASALTKGLLILDSDWSILQIQDRFVTGSTSGTYKLFSAPSGTAIGSGTAIMAATQDISTTPSANTNRTPAKSSVVGASVVPTGSTLGIVFAGTVTGLVGLTITIYARKRSEVPGGLR